MILLIDQGNSRIKWLCVSDDGVIVGRGACPTHISAIEALDSVRSYLSAPLTAAHASVVAGSAKSMDLIKAVRELFALDLVLAQVPQAFGGLTNGYLSPSALGVDRWLAMLGGWIAWRRPLVVVDAGTAMTVDGIGIAGTHLGGYIVPGYRLQCETLGQRTAALPEMVSAAPSTLGWGTSTDAAIARGVLLGLTGIVRAAKVELQAGVADTGAVLITGGDGPALAQALGGDVLLDEDLVFRGLWATASPTGVGLRRSTTVG